MLPLRHEGTSMDRKEVTEWFNNWNSAINAKKTELESNGLLSKRKAVYLSETIVEFQEAIKIKEAYEFYYGYDPDFTW